MAYVRDIQFNGKRVGTLQSDGWVVWPEIDDAAPAELLALHDQRYANEHDAVAAVQAVLNRVLIAAEPVAEPVVSQPVDVKANTRKSAKKH